MFINYKTVAFVEQPISIEFADIANEDQIAVAEPIPDRPTIEKQRSFTGLLFYCPDSPFFWECLINAHIDCSTTILESFKALAHLEGCNPYSFLECCPQDEFSSMLALCLASTIGTLVVPPGVSYRVTQNVINNRHSINEGGELGMTHRTPAMIMGTGAGGVCGIAFSAMSSGIIHGFWPHVPFLTPFYILIPITGGTSVASSVYTGLTYTPMPIEISSPPENSTVAQ